MNTQAIFIVAVTAAVGVFSSSPGTAQPAAAESIKVLHQFGECVVQHNRYLAERILRTVPNSTEEHDLVQEIAIDSCLEEGELEFHAPLLRGVVAEVLFKSDFKAVGAPPLHKTAPVFAALTDQETQKLGPEAKARLVLLQVATCVVRTDPDDVTSLFQTPPRSPAEDAAIAKISPRLSACLNAGNSFTIVLVQLRGALAEAAYRVSENDANRVAVAK
jgi:hypothetical protein